jgi:hypothetical protein
MPATTTLVAINVVTAWVCWRNSKPTEHKVTQPGQPHPYREDLPDQDQSQWPPGLNDEPADPWRDTRYVHMVDPNTGQDYIFVTDSFGGRRAVGDLKSQIANVRVAHPSALPMVQLVSTMMKTRFGQKPRPDFKVVGWRGKQDEAAARASKKIATLVPDGDMDDDIPF